MLDKPSEVTGVYKDNMSYDEADTIGEAKTGAFFVLRDIVGYSELTGRQTFLDMLQFVFEGYHTPDIAYPYLFSYFEGEEWRTQKQAREALEMHFRNGPDGWPGNDNCETLSAWYVFTAMGFYPAYPGTDEYTTGSPFFDKVVIELNPEYYEGYQFVIEAENNGPTNMYIRKGSINDQRIKPQPQKTRFRI